jgi:cell fate (sporulation/competence/biofilm development) regulator YlbF (YheA/YmcA/DUF963 family)
MSVEVDAPLDAILEQAARLGDAMKAHPRFKRLRDAERAVMESQEALLLADGLGRARREHAELLAKSDPGVAVAAERADRIARAAAADPLLRELARAQDEFQQMVNAVSKTMLDVMAP